MTKCGVVGSRSQQSLIARHVVIEKKDEVMFGLVRDHCGKKPQVFSSLTTSRVLCILSQSNSYNVFSGKVCSWFGLSPAEGIGVRVGLYLFVHACLNAFPFLVVELPYAHRNSDIRGSFLATNAFPRGFLRLYLNYFSSPRLTQSTKAIVQKRRHCGFT